MLWSDEFMYLHKTEGSKIVAGNDPTQQESIYSPFIWGNIQKDCHFQSHV